MMKTTGLGLAAVLVCAAAPLFGQMQGVSKPEQVPVTTSSEGISQPVVYEGGALPSVVMTPAKAPTEPMLKVRTEPALEARAELKADEHTNVTEKDDAVAIRAMDRRPLTGALPDPDAGIVTRVEGPSNQLPLGTLFKVRMHEGLTTTGTIAGQEFHADLLEPVERDGRVLIPAGSIMFGRVTDVHGGRRISGSASIHLQPLSVTLPDGTKYMIKGQVIDTSLYNETKVDHEGTILRKDHVGKTLTAMSLTTGAGAAAGAVFGGGVGALVGAGIGAGVSTAWWLKQDRQTELPVDTKITFALTTPLTVGGV
ncbi:hypothetical protein [Granulicella tundricola]|nr:hypothetical protein [Granulicella tundricola]